MLVTTAGMNATCLPLTRFAQDRQTTYRSLRLTTTWRPPGLCVPRHTHDLTSLAWCVEGPFEETVGNRWQRVGMRSLLIRPGGVPHANKYPSQTPSRTLILELLPQTLDDIRTETHVLDAPRCFESARFALFGRRLDVESRTCDSVSSLAIEALVYELIVSTTRVSLTPKDGRPSWLGRVQDYLHAEFTRTISLSEIAKVAGVHPSHLAKAFGRAVGLTVGDYVRQLRVDYSATLLKQGQLSLAEIAVACGFHDQSHFARVFKAHYRVSPSRYASLIGRL